MKKIFPLSLILLILFSCVSNKQVKETPTTTVLHQDPDDELFNSMNLYVENNNVLGLSSLFENNSPASVKKVINRIVFGGRNLLHKAVLAEYEDIVELLLNNGADKTAKDSNGKSAADYAVQARSAKIRELFGIKEQSVVKETNSNNAKESKSNKDDTTKEDPVVTQDNIIQEDAENNKSKVSSEFGIHYTVFFGETKSPLLLAVKKQDYVGVSKAVKSEQNINVTDKLGNNALFYAIEADNSSIINLLLGEYINCNQKNNAGQLPLLYAVEKGNISIITMLLKNGASINQQDADGMTVAWLAVLQRETNLLKFLCSNGANVSGRDGNNNTLLHIAVRNEDVPMVKFLLDKDCDVYTSNDNGVSPLDLMKKSKRRELKRIAEEYEE